jgi:thermitase
MDTDRPRRLLTPILAAVALLLATIVALQAPPPNSAAGPPRDAEIEPGAVLVRYRVGADLARAAVDLEAEGITEASEIRQIRVHKLRVPPGREREFAARLTARPDVEYAEPSALARAQWTPGDPLYPYQWALTRVGAEQAWNTTRGDPAITVAVLDSGFDAGHPDAPAHLVLGHDYITGATVTSDPFGHGTHVTGIIAGSANNGTGVAGLAPDVTLLNIRVLGADGIGNLYTIATAVIDATDAGARVVNLSLGAVSSLYTMQLAVDYAIAHGVIVVAAAGNNGNQTPFYPAAYPNVVAVSATTVDDTKASYSNFGSYVDIAAPGGDNPAAGTPSAETRILNLYPIDATSCQYPAYVSPATPVVPVPTRNPNATITLVPAFRVDLRPGYCTMRGTSMASPHVAALAGLVWSTRSDLGASQVTDIIKTTANPLGQPVPSSQFGYGRIDAAAAVQAALSAPAVTPTSTPVSTPTPTATPAPAGG